MSASIGFDAPTLAAWQALLAAEHAAVFVYRQSGPRLATGDRDLARSFQAAHESSRDQLVAAILAGGATPVAPLAEYPVIAGPDDAASPGRAAQACLSVEEAEARAARGLLLAAASVTSAATPSPQASPQASIQASLTASPEPSPVAGPNLTSLRNEAQTRLTAAAVRSLTWRRRITPGAAGVAFPGL